MVRFRNREEAGRVLTRALASYAGRPDVLVLGLPRGGVPVAAEVARGLGLPLDVFVVRKLGVPGQEELAMGAIASGGVLVLNDEVVQQLAIDDQTLGRVAVAERAELQRREQMYRGARAPLHVAGRTVILVDDGLATGSSMRAAIEALRRRGPHHLVVAVPVGAASTCHELAQEVDELVCARTPHPFYGVGLWYEDFSQTSDEEVRRLLADAGQAPVTEVRA